MNSDKMRKIKAWSPYCDCIIGRKPELAQEAYKTKAEAIKNTFCKVVRVELKIIPKKKRAT